MQPHDDATLWRSAEGVQAWAAEAARQERRRAGHRRFLAGLLPFGGCEKFTFLDLGAGAGAGARAILDRYPRSTAVLADFSAEMMRHGEDELRPYAGRYRYVEFDLASGGGWPEAIPAALDAVVTFLCVHHLPDARKRSLFAEIRERLVPGGWYFNYDPVTAPDPVAQEVWQRVGDREDPEAAARRRDRSTLDQARWDNHVRHIMPLAPQLDYLRAAGFEGVDVYYKQLGDVIYGGRRPA
jgi:tRNA (cmo5U34)-methyltransferase